MPHECLLENCVFWHNTILAASSTEFNTLKNDGNYIIYKGSVRTSHRTKLFSVTKTNWVMVFREILADFIFSSLILIRC